MTKESGVVSATAADLAEPRPSPDQESAHYWAELNEHHIVVQVCSACGRRRFPPTPACPYCAEPESRWERIEGTGTVYSYIVVHRAFDPAFAGEVPYAIATIDFDGGGRIVARTTERPVIGARMRPEFVPHHGWTELRFAPLPDR